METPNGETAPQPVVATMTIGFNPQTGETTVNGPITNIPLCYLILKMGEKAIDELREELKKKAVVPVRKDLVSVLREQRG